MLIKYDYRTSLPKYQQVLISIQFSKHLIRSIYLMKKVKKKLLSWTYVHHYHCHQIWSEQCWKYNFIMIIIIKFTAPVSDCHSTIFFLKINKWIKIITKRKIGDKKMIWNLTVIFMRWSNSVRYQYLTSLNTYFCRLEFFTLFFTQPFLSFFSFSFDWPSTLLLCFAFCIM